MRKEEIEKMKDFAKEYGSVTKEGEGRRRRIKEVSLKKK